MAAAVITETLDLPGGTTPVAVGVTVELATTAGASLPAGYGSVAGSTIIGGYTVAPDATGLWTVTLPRNDEITPSGTVWKITLSGAGVSRDPRYVSVAGAGPFEVSAILTDAPAAVTSSALALHLADTADAHDASAVSVLDTAGNYTATDVEGVLAELPGAFAPITNSIFLPPKVFTSVTGTFTETHYLRHPYMATSLDSGGSTVLQLPSHWNTARAYLRWTNPAATGAGTTSAWHFRIAESTTGTTLALPAGLGATTGIVPAQGVVETTLLISTFAVVPTKTLEVLVLRVTTADTYGSSPLAMMGITLERLT